MDVGIVIIGVIVFCYIYLYLSGKYYLSESFIDPNLDSAATLTNTNGSRLVESKMASGDRQGATEKKRSCKEKILVEQNLNSPFATSAIMEVDDYDYNLVFQNEGDRELSMKMINKLKSQYPLDWSTNPPSSATFQAGMKRMKESFKDSPAQPKDMDPYNEISGASLQPPDTSIQEMEERKILQTYQPRHGDDITTYNVHDAEKLITKVYDAKGLIPTVIHKDPNVYEIVGTRRKDQKILYEDEEAPAQRAPVSVAGEARITVPVTATDTAAGLDPFYTPAPNTHEGRWNYQKFTPGLERMFAPSQPEGRWS